MTGAWRDRGLAGVLVAGGVLWVVAGVLVVWEPAGMPAARVYSILVPVALGALLIGSAGLGSWLSGQARQAGTRSTWRSGLSTGLLAMSSRRYRAISGPEGDSDSSRLSARRLGLLSVRAGAIAAAVAGLVLQGEAGALRSVLHTGWFLLFAGAAVLGVAVMTSEVAPRWSGALLLGSSVLALSTFATVLTGSVRRAEALGPLLPSTAGRPVVSLLPWLLFGAGCAWLGVARWSASGRVAHVSDRPSA